MNKFWTEEKINFLKNNVDNYTNKELSTLFDVTPVSVRQVLKRNGIKRKSLSREIKYKEVYKVDYLDTPCQECTSHYVSKDGYPIKKIGNKTTHMARYIYEKHYKTKIPEGMIVRHECDNSACINPLHLKIGTIKDNSDDKVKRNRHKKGMQIHTSKLTEQQVIEIKKELQHYSHGDLKILAKKYNVDASLISNIKSNTIWKHIII